MPMSRLSQSAEQALEVLEDLRERKMLVKTLFSVQNRTYQRERLVAQFVPLKMLYFKGTIKVSTPPTPISTSLSRKVLHA